MLAKRTKFVGSAIRELDLIAAQMKKEGKDVIKLNIGDTAAYFPTPKYVMDAYIEALKENKNFYSISIGIEELRYEISKYYYDFHGVEFTPNDVFVTAGISESLNFLNAALIDPGDMAALFVPYYPPYLNFLRFYGGRPLFINYLDGSSPAENLEKEVKKLKSSGKLKKLKYILVTSPSNPSGRIATKKELEELVDIANNYGILIVSDEIYDGISFKPFTSLGKVAKGVPHVIFNGASKVLRATGFRIGYTVIPENDELSKELKQKFIEMASMRLSVNTPAQYAVAEGYRMMKQHMPEIESVNNEIKKRLEMFLNLLDPEFFEGKFPDGAFYLFPKLKLEKLEFKDDKEFSRRLLEEKYVQLVGGSGFGVKGNIRIVGLVPPETIQKATQRINEFCRSHKKK